MVIPPLMSKARWLALASLNFGLCSVVLNACTSDGRPDSLVSAGGESGRGNGAAGHGGGNAGDAGATQGDAGKGDGGGADAGAGGEGDAEAAPIANFPQQIQVDVSCASNEPSELVIRNDGILPLIISRAEATGGYAVKSPLPLQIAPLASAVLSVAPPAPSATSTIGDTSSGTLSFVTNEGGETTHEVALNTTLFGGQLEFTDSTGTPLDGALPLSYSISDACPDTATYRVHNTGNLVFTLLGPTFPAHLAGTGTGASGHSIAPDQYFELKVGADSSSDGACSASGDLIFTARGAFCGRVPKLSVIWPANVETSGCACTTDGD